MHTTIEKGERERERGGKRLERREKESHEVRGRYQCDNERVKRGESKKMMEREREGERDRERESIVPSYLFLCRHIDYELNQKQSSNIKILFS